METEVTNISSHGFWILSSGKEHFLPFDDFPWFKNKTVKEITNLQAFGEDHLYWDDLDVDLTIEMIEHPERFPLQSRVA